MLLFLIEYLQQFHWKIPAAFGYFSTRMILAAGTALLMTIFMGPRFIKKLYELKIGQEIRSVEECPLLAELHGKKKDTPTMGGVLILFSMAVSLFLWMDLRSAFTWLLLLTTVVLGCLGAADDYLKLRYKNSKGLKARKKIACQVLFSGFVGLYLLCPSITQALSVMGYPRAPVAKEQTVVPREGKRALVETKALSTQQYAERFYVPFFKGPVFVGEGVWRFLSFLLIVLVITGSSNAVNLTDGLDGLAAGCLVMVSLVLALFSFLSNHIDLARY
ncbi:MAG: phospho-N-acetylmuramoyl-pentapeptide-transferase, partial [Chlamydiae bacterium RIFCSPHIGHO2_12_FULL_49_9]